jgi:hypothetical protein
VWQWRKVVCGVWCRAVCGVGRGGTCWCRARRDSGPNPSTFAHSRAPCCLRAENLRCLPCPPEAHTPAPHAGFWVSNTRFLQQMGRREQGAEAVRPGGGAAWGRGGCHLGRECVAVAQGREVAARRPRPPFFLRRFLPQPCRVRGLSCAAYPAPQDGRLERVCTGFTGTAEVVPVAWYESERAIGFWGGNPAPSAPAPKKHTASVAATMRTFLPELRLRACKGSSLSAHGNLATASNLAGSIAPLCSQAPSPLDAPLPPCSSREPPGAVSP